MPNNLRLLTSKAARNAVTQVEVKAGEMVRHLSVTLGVLNKGNVGFAPELCILRKECSNDR